MTLNHLKGVKLINISGRRPEMQLIKLLLAKSPALVKMVIDPHYALNGFTPLAPSPALGVVPGAVNLEHTASGATGPITKLTICFPCFVKCPKIDNLICFLSKNGIQHLVLKIHTGSGSPYELPSSFFTCLHLRHLTLQRCIIHPPPGFKGFDKLISLELCQVTISSEFLGSLISNSPLLEHLVLEPSYDLNNIEVNAPKLRSFFFIGGIHIIRLQNVPLLAKVSILFRQFSVKAGKPDLAKFFEPIHALEHLHWNCYRFWRLFAEAVEVPRRLSSALNCLKHLYMDSMCLDELHDLQDALCLIRSSPYLEDIEMKVYQCFHPNEYPDPDKMLDPATRDYVTEIPASFSDVTLNHLRAVKLIGVAGTWPEMQLIKLVLAKSPALVRMVIDPYDTLEDKKSLKVVAEITKFQRASSKAEVAYNVD
ncbi:PREDICTED: F-box/FBD/LRR-repeat protein At1g13570-like [Nicotiana attenuata]|uniref:F-box/FBD/LRR-repeat protein At1g13570-like n=1 Tax=Nicotiana attenuata TaxID=49451 RepID=UPI0009046938|nr:PREDICTED: F-box/FBD/LRR-repeat protein At1g13570-like [Nicotiana attenuata]